MPRSRCRRQGRALSKVSGGGCQPLSWLLVLLAALVVLQLVTRSLPVSSQGLSLCACLCSSYKDTGPQIRDHLPPPDFISPPRHLQRPCFQKWSRAQVLRGRTWLGR